MLQHPLEDQGFDFFKEKDKVGKMNSPHMWVV